MDKQCKPYPAWVCIRCGDKYGRKKHGVSTWHYDDCGVCGKHTIVTEPRDFGHLMDGWQYEQPWVKTYTGGKPNYTEKQNDTR